jgi:hypothetical protein
MNVPFDYSIDESFNTDYDKAPYAKTAELTERWRKQIKLSALSLDGAFESSRKQTRVLKAKAKRRYTRCFKVSE